MRLDRRTVLRSLAILFGILILGGAPWPRLPLFFGAVYSRVANFVVFDHTTFGHGGHAHLDALAALSTDPSDNVTADTVLVLTVDQANGVFPLGMSLRRDAYLPLLLVAAVVVAAPGVNRRRIRTLVVGLTIIYGCTLAVIDLLVRRTFAMQMRTIYDTSPFWQGVVDLAYNALLVPPANRFIVPIAVGVVLVWPHWRDFRSVGAANDARIADGGQVSRRT